MDSTILAITITAVIILIAAAIGLLKFRTKPEKREKFDDIILSPADLESQTENKKNKKQNNVRDEPAFNRLQKFIDSNWIKNFEDNQLAYPQYVQAAITDDLHSYWNESKKAENEFSNQNLAEAHLVFIKAIKTFINTALRETTFVRPESKASVVNSKAEGRRKSSNDYDERYEREVRIISNKAKGIISAYKRYVQVAESERVYLQEK
jgi:hypothetical protein